MRIFRLLIQGALILAPLASPGASPERPNIVLIYADDLGYGDVSCYGATRVKTPHIDRLAAEGLRFTDAHSPAATCTPSRFSLLTGEYAWRKKGTGVLPGNAPLIIPPGTPTLPGMLQKAGYATAVVGKWHLGLGPEGGPDWNGDIKPGPLEIGFSECFILPATGDRTPCVYVRNHRIVGLDPLDPIVVSYGKPITNEPTGKLNPELLKVKPSHGHDQAIVNGISRIGHMAGARAARWVDEDMADVITREAVSFIERNRARPFFLYFSTHDIHVPRVPHARFVNKTEMGPRGDVIAELDWCAGEIQAALDRLNLAANTLVIFTSDNGPVVDDGYQDDAVKKLGAHRPAGPLRGTKYTAYEGGTRVPFLARWPGRIKPGVSDALLCQIDLFASMAKLVGEPLTTNAAPDSFDVLPALLGESKAGREVLVEQGGPLALRQGSWKLISAVPRPRARQAAAQAKPAVEPGDKGPKMDPALPTPQLYNLAIDLSETNNLAARNPAKVKEMSDAIEKIRAAERSRP
jgi:arylsulfatase A-like enzyme